jgi:uncharacterized radical SAM protein YgiQ
MKTENAALPFLPVSRNEIELLSWDQPDIIIVTGDAYIDHPSFGAAIMGRMAEKLGMRVAILPQPNWRDDLRDFKKLGVPRYFFGVTAGSMDSMVNHYTALRRRRSDDAYTPGGRPGYRPDYASVVYTQILKKLYPEVPVVLGGVEASMRRFTHYDYWQDKVKPSILTESGADLLLYGMGEQAWKMIISLMKKGVPLTSLHNIPQTGFLWPHQKDLPPLKNISERELPSHDDCMADKTTFASAFRMIEEVSNTIEAPRLLQRVDDQVIVVNPPFPIPDGKDADEPYELAYARKPHPHYDKKPPVPTWEMIKHSVNIHRGCFGGCSFCAINMHQGKFVVSRSEESVLKEVEKISQLPGFKGHITDLGGPSANMYRMEGIDKEICRKCKRPSCIFPNTCKNLNFDHNPLLQLYEKAEKIQGIKKITIGSGVRYDMLLGKTEQQNRDYALKPYIRKLIRSHVSGRLKVAPEHTSTKVLNIMRKPSFSNFEKFHEEFRNLCRKENLPWQLVPYFISGHPGTMESDMKDLSRLLSKLGYSPEQVQEFTPTPMTLATTMYYTGIDPYTGKRIFVVRDDKAKRQQKGYFFATNEKKATKTRRKRK